MLKAIKVFVCSILVDLFNPEYTQKMEPYWQEFNEKYYSKLSPDLQEKIKDKVTHK